MAATQTVVKKSPKTCPVVQEWVEQRGVCDYCGDAPEVHDKRWTRSPATRAARREQDREKQIRRYVRDIGNVLPNPLTTEQKVILEEAVVMNLGEL